MIFSVFIFILVLVVSVYAIKTYISIITESNRGYEICLGLQSTLQNEIQKQKSIKQKLKLLDGLNHILKRNIFKIVKDVFEMQKQVLNK
ncbi:hypothetical protein [Hanstruepera marina]|uniref:hypothetical protein n=1 Tax=Hanstruepera marina TaxID=2873265 RepID=UPI001CA6B3A7|nr:hypothetical protein [Hanstruepera marina]